MIKIKNIQGQTWIIIILVILNLGTLGFIWLHRPIPAQCSAKFSPKVRMERFLIKRIGFDAKQSDEFRKIQENHFAQIWNIRKVIMEKKHLLYDKILNNESTDTDIQRLTKELSNLYVQQETANCEHIIQIKGICTPEQSKKMKSIFGRILYHEKYPYNMKNCRDNNINRKRIFYNNNH